MAMKQKLMLTSALLASVPMLVSMIDSVPEGLH